MSWTADAHVDLNAISGTNNHPGDITGDPPVLSAGTWVLQDGNGLAVTAQCTGYSIVEFPSSLNGPLEGTEEIDGTITMKIHGSTVGTASAPAPAASWSATLTPSGSFTAPGGETVDVTLEGAGTVTGDLNGEQFEARTGIARMWSLDDGLDNPIGLVVTFGDAIGGGSVDGEQFECTVGPVSLGYEDIVSYTLTLTYTLASGTSLSWSDDYPVFDPGSFVDITTNGGSGSPTIGPWDVTDIPFIRLQGIGWDAEVNPDDASDFVDIVIVPAMATRDELQFQVFDTAYDIFIRPA